MSMIETENLSFKYPEAAEKSVDQVSFTVEAGQWLTIVGKNGSGKSTLIFLLDGLLKADSGRILIDGQILSQANLWDIRKKIGIVFQNPDNQFVAGSVIEDVAFGMENLQVPRDQMLARAYAALKTVDMAEFADKQPALLSGGQKQRVAIAGILAIQPKILILDEATSMLDPDGRDEVWQTIRKLRAQKQLTIISISHDLNELALSDRVLLMNQGRIAADTSADQLLSTPDLLTENNLSLPFLQQLQADLHRQGVKIPKTYHQTKELIEFLWQSHSTM
ncbi:energy-coupling factor transporter ATPase [Oenococcus kitaharae]|uniref:ECF transporter ATPase component n=1 Tax=Oenococcus kitaharae DSM 17330 TaxID=1045004 RepID=G9WIL3_9LACO|nr:energy-coupling factor transporter ATPase [Oenococcus kitaharae]EHN58152.1 ECF transporter ATPase component [Oenococcus kitaharae DSM 17330]OEY81643.1 cobalt transporter ATP-binding subunit [Oenococcus kitaharae]OEY83128.1 cobalt transporter ATP-binding subunit [Oenococcus kitaharae]OEY84326.1 cobalt transporter ATP-binding subunit [Oenococcus kitaharae]